MRSAVAPLLLRCEGNGIANGDRRCGRTDHQRYGSRGANSKAGASAETPSSVAVMVAPPEATPVARPGVVVVFMVAIVVNMAL